MPVLFRNMTLGNLDALSGSLTSWYGCCWYLLLCRESESMVRVGGSEASLYQFIMLLSKV